eukprot:gb/GECG01007347.1/.p1 GENE.gb/GECG01007347.1/~~gb/GECG01007347.1/.p1  ORF type:complete len:810 (+),score=143.16 gb/GECG01007347.1/:1-2430(+)
MPPRKRRLTRKQQENEESNAATGDTEAASASGDNEQETKSRSTRTAANKRTRASEKQEAEHEASHESGTQDASIPTKKAKTAKKQVQPDDDHEANKTEQPNNESPKEEANGDYEADDSELLEKPTEILEAEQKVLKEDRYDMDAWNILINFAKSQPPEVARETFEELLNVFPTAAEYWRLYAEKEHNAGNIEEAEGILSRCLLAIPDPQLWKFYLDFVHDTKLSPALEKQRQEQEQNAEHREGEQEVLAARVEISKAYDFALQHIGKVHGTDEIWRQYLKFLKQDLGAGSQYEQNQKKDALRRQYQEALKAPLDCIDAIWQEYNAFAKENNDSVTEEDKRNYERSKKAAQHRSQRWTNIQLYLLPRPLRRGDDSAFRNKLANQVALWRQLLQYEASNPLELEDEQHQALMRIQYEQSLLAMQYMPDIWQDWALFEIDHENTDEAAEIYDRALQNIPDCATLSFVVADFYELSDNRSKAQEVYEKLLQDAPSPVAFIQYQRFMRRYDGIKGARKVFSRARKSPQICPAIFLAAAQLEFHANRAPDVAVNVLELGRKKFPEDVEYAVAYLNFIAPISEDNNMRALFENILLSVPVEKARPIWDMYLDYELRRAQSGGSLEKVAMVEARRAQKYPQDDSQTPSPFLRLLHRYQHWGLLPDGAPDQDMLSRYRVRPRLFHTSSGGYFNAEDPVPEGLQDFLPSSFTMRNQHKFASGPVESQQDQAQEASKRPIPPNTPEFLHKMIRLIPMQDGEQPPPDAEINYVLNSFKECDLPPPPAENGEAQHATDSSGSDLYRQRQRQQMEATGALDLK